MIIWIWGRPCSGKTTLAGELYNYFKSLKKEVELIDSDYVRKRSKDGGNFDFKSRCLHMDKLRFMTQMTAKCNEVVIVAAITPYKGMRYRNRKAFGRRLVEVYMNASFQACADRDDKGLYVLAKEGKIEHFTGISDKLDKGETHDIECNTEIESIEESKYKVLNYLNIKSS